MTESDSNEMTSLDGATIEDAAVELDTAVEQSIAVEENGAADESTETDETAETDESAAPIIELEHFVVVVASEFSVLRKNGEFVELGGDTSSAPRAFEFKDEALNALVDHTIKDPNLRAEVKRVSVDLRRKVLWSKEWLEVEHENKLRVQAEKAAAQAAQAAKSTADDANGTDALNAGDTASVVVSEPTNHTDPAIDGVNVASEDTNDKANR